MKNINSYKNDILHEWMSARIAFALTLPYCKSKGEKVALLMECEDKMLDSIFYTLEPAAGEYARRLLVEHPLYSCWEELEKESSDMEEKSVYSPREVYNAVRPNIIALQHAGLAEVETSECGEGVYIGVRACGQVLRKVARIIAQEV